jgi:CDP-diacylglycerol--serine O-phosphatidyltransferase
MGRCAAHWTHFSVERTTAWWIKKGLDGRRLDTVHWLAIHPACGEAARRFLNLAPTWQIRQKRAQRTRSLTSFLPARGTSLPVLSKNRPRKGQARREEGAALPHPSPGWVSAARDFVNKPSNKLIWLPSAFTTISLLCGFIAIILAANPNVPHRFLYVPLLVAIAVFCDGIDGRVARAVGACTEFGENFDSFADLTTFGIAPAFMVYQMYLSQVGMINDIPVGGILIASTLVFSNAFRLARFATKPYNPRCFEGMATTAGGGLIATLAFWDRVMTPMAAASIVLVTAFLMSSHIEFPKLNAIFGRAPFMLKWSFLLAIVAILILVWPAGLTLIAGAYALYAVLWSSERAVRRRFRRVAPVVGVVSGPVGAQIATMTMTVDEDEDDEDETEAEEDWDDDWEDEEAEEDETES